MEQQPPAYAAWPGIHALQAGLRKLLPHAAALLRIIFLGPWVVWKKNFHDHQVVILLHQRLLGLAFLAALVTYLLAPGVVTATSLAGLAGILLWGFFWARSMALRVTASRRLHYHAVQVGDELEENFQLINPSGSRVLWAEVVDHSQMPGYSVSAVRAADPRQTVNWRVHTVCARRGVFSLGPWELQLGDPFGIFRVIQSYTDRREILVYPQLADLPRRILPHQRLIGEKRPLRQPLPAESILAFSARSFAPGDPLRHIHWRTTARKNTLYSRQFEPEAATRVWLIPDLDGDSQLTYQDQSTLETAVTLTATLAALLLEEHLEVGLAANADRQSILLPRRGSAQLWPILMALAPLKVVFNQTLAATLTRMQPLIQARDLTLVITPSLSPDWPPALRRLSAGARGGAAGAYLLDPASFGSSQSAEAVVPVLTSLGIESQVIRAGDLKPQAAVYGPLSRWEFTTTGTGKVVVRHSPRLKDAAAYGISRNSREDA